MKNNLEVPINNPFEKENSTEKNQENKNNFEYNLQNNIINEVILGKFFFKI